MSRIGLRIGFGSLSVISVVFVGLGFDIWVLDLCVGLLRTIWLS